MISALFSRLIILSFGTLYPAYASYKAVRTKNVKEYVKWMMYWIVYAFFTCTETITDIFLSWFPFYYEVKVVIVIWLLSPATKGSSTLYRKFVHPMLTRREQEIDDYLNQAKERGYSAMLQLGSKSVNYATNVIMQTALKLFNYGLNTSNHRRRPDTFSLSHLDGVIYTHNHFQNQEEFTVKEDNQWVACYSSNNNLVFMHIEFSEDDEQVSGEQIDEKNVVLTKNSGAARIRVLSTRKTKTKESKSTATEFSKLSNNSKVPASRICPQQKLHKATSDLDVDIE